MKNLEKYLSVSEEVKQALAEGKPVVALESTIISHGMPYPKNVETALNVEKIVRENGAVPATIAIIKGKITVGLSPEEIEYLGKEGLAVTKASRRDLPVLCALGANGATTVATTMIGAALAGVKIFATGGIGGVHRGAQETMDISADLQEFAHTNVCVVSAGCKSILDIGLTLEYLETYGVPVLGYQTSEFPCFYCETSGFGVDYAVKDAKEVADILKTKWDLGLQGGVLVGNPIPHEYSMDHKVIDEVINKALDMAKEQGIKGKATTPFLLAMIKDLTGGDSLASNLQLAYNNAKVASQIAVEFSKK